MALVFSLLAFPTNSQPLCGSIYAAKPAALSASLLTPLERLYEGIPSLSPREKQWIKEELEARGRRLQRVYSSREYAQQEAKINAGSLLAGIRILTKSLKPKHQLSPTENWLIFVYTLIESDVGLHLAGLVTEGVIQRGIIPIEWTYLAGENYELRLSIRAGRVNLARHILVCTLPKVIGSTP